MFRSFLYSLALLCGIYTTPTFADTPDLYMHNGSLVEFVWDEEVGEWFDIKYIEPRSGLNVAPGTILGSGSVPANGEVSATVRTFKRGCPPAEYVVTGRFADDGTLTLRGKAPIRAKKGCNIIRYDTTGNSRLVFIRY